MAQSRTIITKKSLTGSTAVFSRRALWLTAAVSIFAIAVALPASATEPVVKLGSASTFAVLAGSGITNTGFTKLSGSAGADIGSHPTGSFTGHADVTTTGTTYLEAHSVVEKAKSDLVVAYNSAAGLAATATVTADLGGQTLFPGIYNSASSLGLTGTLVLDAKGDPDAVFVFQAGSTLTTASSKVLLRNGAQACNVFWQVGSSATFGTGSHLSGQVLALQSITATTGATFDGQLLARNGAVTLDTNTIVNDACAAVVTPDPPTEDGPEEVIPDVATPEPEPAPVPAPESHTVDGGTLPETDAIQWVATLALGAGVLALATTALIRSRKRS